MIANMYHCSSSQPLEELLKAKRIMALAALTRHASSTSRLQTYPIFSLRRSMALLTASNGRILLSLRRGLLHGRHQRASLGPRATCMRPHGSLSGAIAASVLPSRLAVLTATAKGAGRLIVAGQAKAVAPNQRASAPSIG